MDPYRYLAVCVSAIFVIACAIYLELRREEKR